MLASETRKLAREALAGKWGKAALITLVYILLTSGISLVLNYIPVVGSIAQFVIEVPIAFGLISTFMKLKRGEEVSYVGFLTDGFNKFTSSWEVSLWTFVKMIVPIIIIIVAIVILVISSGVTLVGATASNSSAAIGAGGTLAVISIIAMIAASIWLTIKSYSYQLVYYILFDSPDKNAKEIVEESEKLMVGNRWRLFCLELSFIGWMILAAFTFGIGMLWLLPYMAVAQIVFYEVLVGKKSTTVEVKAEPITEQPQDEPVQEDNGPISEA